MKKTAQISLFFFLFVSILSCTERDYADVKIKGEDFKDLYTKAANICYKLDNETCKHLKDAIRFFSNRATEAAEDSKLFQSINGRTPNAIIEIYKKTLLKDLEDGRRNDEEILKNLNDLKSEYEKTKRFAGKIVVSNISVDLTLRNKKSYNLSFDITNNTTFNIKQCVAEAEFYTQSETFLGREKAFSNTFPKPIQPGKTARVRINSENIPNDDLVLIRAARNLKTKVIITSLQTDSTNDNESVIILALPYSYYKMLDLLRESEDIYNKTVEKIKAINTKN